MRTPHVETMIRLLAGQTGWLTNGLSRPRHNRRMNLDDLRAVLADHHHGVIATYRPSGGVQLSPVLVSLDAEDRVIISSRQGAHKRHRTHRTQPVRMSDERHPRPSTPLRVAGRMGMLSESSA